MPRASIAVTQTTEDKQIKILHLHIRLTELTRENTIHASSSQMQDHPVKESSTPTSGISGLSYFSEDFTGNNYLNAESHVLPDHNAHPSASGDVRADVMCFNFAA